MIQDLTRAPDSTLSPYNYDRFTFALEADELAGWLSSGPRLGQPAPSFALDDLDGHPVRLDDFRGQTVVLEFGSYTCPIFADRIPEMERLAQDNPDAVFLVIYVREAHPGEHQEPHRSLEHKRLAAHKLRMEEALVRRVVVDALDGTTHRAYGGAWNPVYVIGPDGRVAMRQAWNHPRDVASALAAVRQGAQPAIAESVEMLREPGRAPMGLRLLERGGVRALEDFYRTAPTPVQHALKESSSADVRAAIARFDVAEVVTVRSADGTPIALWKTGTGPSLLAVHGTCADHSAWDRVVPLLADRFTVYAMDRRGRGASGDGADYALAREVEDVVAAIESLPRPVYLYGHSSGGCIAADAAARTPVDGMVLYEGGPRPPGLRLTPDEFIDRLEELIQAGQREQAVVTFMLNAAGVAPEELDVLRGSSSWSARVAAAHTVPRELRVLNESDGADLERFRSIAAPVLLVVGESTEPRRRALFERMSALFADPRVTVLPGQRHAAHQTAPDVLAAAIRDFVLDRERAQVGLVRTLET